MGLEEECALVKMSDNYYKIIISTVGDPYLSMTKISSLSTIVDKLNKLPEVKVVEFVGTEKYFTAGGSLHFLSGLNANGFPEMLAKIPETILQIKAITVASMRGHALGGGLATGLWTDLPCLCEDSLYGANFMSLGFTPGMGSTIVLEDYFSKPLAHEMLLTGKLYKGKILKSFACPIAYRIYSSAEFSIQVDDLIQALLEVAYKPLMLFKQSLAERRIKTLSIAAVDEIKMHKICFADDNIIRNIEQYYLGDNDAK